MPSGQEWIKTNDIRQQLLDKYMVSKDKQCQLEMVTWWKANNNEQCQQRLPKRLGWAMFHYSVNLSEWR